MYSVDTFALLANSLLNVSTDMMKETLWTFQNQNAVLYHALTLITQLSLFKCMVRKRDCRWHGQCLLDDADLGRGLASIA